MKTTTLLLLAVLAGCAQADMKETAPQELLQRQTVGEKVLVLDVRTPQEFAEGHVPGAVNLPHDQITGQEPVLKEWKDKPVVVYCRSGRRSASAGAVLEKAGFTKLEHLTGDMMAWQAQGKPVSTEVCTTC